MEECAELQQAISKALRFGLNSCHPDTPDRTNALDIQTEYTQLGATMLLLERRGVLRGLPLSEAYIIRGEKIANIEKYETVSKSLGRIKDEPTQEEVAEAEECISRQALLDLVDSIWDCNDMVFEGDRDHSCRPEDCKGCHWADTKRYIQKLIERAPAVAVRTKEAQK